MSYSDDGPLPPACGGGLGRGDGKALSILRAPSLSLLLAEPLTPKSGVERIAHAIQRRAKEVLGVEVPTAGVPLYTDARHYAAAGIPIVLYGAGPRSIGEANAHNANENLRLEDLRAATKIIAMAVADLLAGAVS